MTSPARRLLHAFAPRWLRALRKRRCELSFSGPYPSWAAARAASQGYDDADILRRTVKATRTVVRGQAAYDRDTVTFAQPLPDLPLIEELQRVARIQNSRLRVLDFGGALGSSYRQNRPFLASVSHLEWRIVEQATVAAAGSTEFTTTELKFSSSLDEAIRETPPDFVLLSSVLQYLEDPDPVLRRLLTLPAEAFYVARTPFWDGPADRLLVQKVPPAIYPRSYPMRVFARAPWLARWLEAGIQPIVQPAVEGIFDTCGLKFGFETHLGRRATARPANHGPQSLD